MGGRAADPGSTRRVLGTFSAIELADALAVGIPRSRDRSRVSAPRRWDDRGVDDTAVAGSPSRAEEEPTPIRPRTLAPRPLVVGHSPLGEPKREHGGKQPPLEAPQVVYSDHLHPTAEIRRGRPDLPGAPGLEDVRVGDRSLDRSGPRPVVAQALPDVPDQPRVARSGGTPPRRTSPVSLELKVLDVHVRPHLGPPLGEVTRGLEDPVERRRSRQLDRLLGSRAALGRSLAPTAPLPP